MPIAMYPDLWYNYYSKEKELLNYERQIKKNL